MDCGYIKEVMKEWSMICGTAFRWEGSFILEGWHNWCIDPGLRKFRALPLLVIWGVWLARNQYIFSDKVCLPVITASQSCGLLSFPPQNPKRKRFVGLVEVDKTLRWDFLMGLLRTTFVVGVLSSIFLIHTSLKCPWDWGKGQIIMRNY